MNRRPIAIDLFAGAGGMSLGFEQAGFDIAAAIEIDPIHASTHHYNFPKTRMIAGSAIGLKGKEIREIADLGNRSISVIFGGPPCQGFSLIGHRLLDDSRNELVKEFVRLVVELESQSFVFENVKGLTIGKHRMFLEALVKSFEDNGYNVRIPWKVLNSSNFGVPQDRQRLFLIGSKKGLNVPEYPEIETLFGNSLFSQQNIRITPTCSEALSGLPDVDQWGELVKSDSIPFRSPIRISKYAKEMRCENNQNWHFGYRRMWNPSELTSSMRTIHSEISKKRFAEAKEGEIEPISRFFKLPKEGVCNTLRAGTDSARGAFTSPRPIHFSFPRCITVREMARLHGYPDWFRFHVTKWHGARQIGNSVPPPLARAVAIKIMHSLGYTPERPKEILSLGEDRLLGMNMQQAAAFWNVPVLIAKRNKINGYHKRKQTEIEKMNRIHYRRQA